MSELSPDEEGALAASALAGGDLPQAVHHLAGALAVDPHRAEWLALCEELFAASPDPVALTAPGDRPWFGNVALHARALARDNRHTEAIHRILEVAAVRPDVPYLAWTAAWLDEPASAADPTELVDAIARYVDRFSTADLQDPEKAAQFAAILPLLDRLSAWSEPYIAWLRAIVLRRLNRNAEALTASEQAYARFPSWQSAVAVANAHRASGSPEDAIAWFERAASMVAGDAAHLDALVAYARAHRDDVRAQQLILLAAGPPTPGS